MSNGRWDGPNNNFRHNRDNRHGGPFFIFDLMFSMISLGVTLAMNMVGIVFHILGEVLSFGANRNHRPPVNMNMNQNNCNTNGGCNSNRGAARNINNNQGSQARNINNMNNPQNTNNTNNRTEASVKNASEKVHEKANNKKQPENDKGKNSSDWNIVIFILTLIPVIVFLAMEMLMYAGASVLIGIALMILYNIGRGIGKASRKKAEEKATAKEAVNSEDNEAEKLIKEAFDKVYVIRKNVHKVQNDQIRSKVDNLCGLSEKIIGEVRTNPENMKIVKKFFYYYLDAFNDIFNRYLRISSFSNSSEDIDKTIKETEKSFDEIENILQDLCEDLIESDMMNIKATINVIKNSQ